jgi:uncharacterized protein YjlB
MFFVIYCDKYDDDDAMDGTLYSMDIQTGEYNGAWRDGIFTHHDYE